MAETYELYVRATFSNRIINPVVVISDVRNIVTLVTDRITGIAPITRR